jgi:hypothetical protein
MNDLSIEQAGSTDLGPCSCCGHDTRRVWGYVSRGPLMEAAYFVEWTLGRVAEDGAHFDFVVGRWGDGASRADRSAISLESS